jgi:acyl-CoA hydrolase
VQHTNSCYLTFVALDDATGRPVEIPPVIPETPDEQRRFAQALARRAQRLELKRKAQDHERAREAS